MSEARAGHTATALADGRVLIAGGRTSAGVTSSFELYDPASGVSTVAGALSLPRVHHAAARLIDKRVLIVGGSDGNMRARDRRDVRSRDRLDRSAFRRPFRRPA